MIHQILNARGYAISIILCLIPAPVIFAVDGPTGALISRYIGFVAIISMAISQIIATRVNLIEIIFGPLDKAYLLHKWLGITALVTALLHYQIDAKIPSLGPNTALNELSNDLGLISLYVLIALVLISLIKLIPYRLWYWTHRFMSIVFILAAGHYLLLKKPFSDFDPLGLYMLAICAIGMMAIIYTLLPRSLRIKHAYKVSHVEKTGNAIAVTLKPKKGKGIRHLAGQFAFFTPVIPGMSETHPFTISSAPQSNGQLRVTIAGLGDYTNMLQKRLIVGDSVAVQGAYGHFKMPRRNRPQVWIAGGVGITPFLAWLGAAKTEGPKVDLFYCFKGENATHLSELKAKAAANPRVTLHLLDNEKYPFLTADDVRAICPDKKTIFAFCGPAPMREALRSKLGGQWIYEEFEIRSGLPLLADAYKILRAKIRYKIKISIELAKS